MESLNTKVLAHTEVCRERVIAALCLGEALNAMHISICCSIDRL